MKSKSVTYAALLLAAAFAFSLPARADMDDHDGMKMEDHMKERSEQKLKTLTEKLTLTTDQQATVKAALEEQRTKMEALRKDHMAQMKTIHEDADSKIEASLNADQKAKFEKLEAEWKEKRQENMEHHMKMQGGHGDMDKKGEHGDMKGGEKK